MNTRRILALTAISALLATPALAADSGAIAVINMQQVMAQSTAAQNVREQLDDKYKTFQGDFNKKREQFQKEEEDLSKQRGVLSKSAFEEKARAFEKKETEAQKDVQSRKTLLDNAADHASMEIQKAIIEIAADLAKEKGFSLAVPTQTILYADPKLDISDEVLKRLNQKLPKLDVKFDAEKK